MASKTTKSSNGPVASALLMLLALLWLTVSTPFVYAAQQKQTVVEKSVSATEDDTNPLAGTNEEKSESGVNSLSEYLHECTMPASPAVPMVKWEKCHPSDLYFAYHPELLCPPPNAAV